MKFKVRVVKDAPLIEAEQIDLGLCYVTMFIVGDKEFYSVFPRVGDETSAVARLRADEITMRQHGVYPEEGECGQ